jgi:predicted O-methyltransferase YrrM
LLLKEDKHSLQSPFLFKIYLELSNFISERKETDLDIEEMRQLLLASQKTINVEDYGAGSKMVNSKIRQISKITRYSTSSRKFAQLYQYFCSLTPADTVIELGTCMGLTSRYLSRISSSIIYTVEGSEEILSVAKGIGKTGNIEFVNGKINEALGPILQKVDKVDFALIDANHTYSGTIDAYRQIKSKLRSTSILAIGDIHWSSDMETAWKEIIRYEEVKLSLDFLECGIIFFDAPIQKENYILDF